MRKYKFPAHDNRLELQSSVFVDPILTEFIDLRTRCNKAEDLIDKMVAALEAVVADDYDTWSNSLAKVHKSLIVAADLGYCNYTKRKD